MKDKITLERGIAFLEAMGVTTKEKVIKLYDGGNSVVVNPNTEWKEFLGYSINEIAEYVAEQTNKKTEWYD